MGADYKGVFSCDNSVYLQFAYFSVYVLCFNKNNSTMTINQTGLAWLQYLGTVKWMCSLPSKKSCHSCTLQKLMGLGLPISSVKPYSQALGEFSEEKVGTVCLSSLGSARVGRFGPGFWSISPEPILALEPAGLWQAGCDSSQLSRPGVWSAAPAAGWEHIFRETLEANCP